MQVASTAKTQAIKANSSPSLLDSAWLGALAVFCIAFAIRLLFNLCWCEHRIVDIGDGYLYLLTGNKLLTAIQHSGSLSQLLTNIGQHSAQPLDGLLTSTRLADRLLLDGPVYPLYLSLVQWIAGMPAGTTNFSLFTQPLTIAYSLTDSLTC